MELNANGGSDKDGAVEEIMDEVFGHYYETEMICCYEFKAYNGTYDT